MALLESSGKALRPDVIFLYQSLRLLKVARAMNDTTAETCINQTKLHRRQLTELLWSATQSLSLRTNPDRTMANACLREALTWLEKDLDNLLKETTTSPVSKQDADQRGRNAYIRYNAAKDFVTAAGSHPAPWPELSDVEKHAWICAATEPTDSTIPTSLPLWTSLKNN